MSEWLFDKIGLKLTELHYCLFGSKRLMPHEQLCLDGWRASLSDKNKQILDAQLEGAHHRRRYGGGAKVCFYYPKGKNVPLFKTSCPILHVATVFLQSLGGAKEKRMRAKIYVVDGRFFSIEFPKRPKRYMQLHNMQEPLQVAEVLTKETLD